MSSTVIPTLRYEDAPGMIDWLCRTIGFARHLVVEDGQGGIAHAQLSLGPGFSCRDPEGHLRNIGTYDPWAEPG